MSYTPDYANTYAPGLVDPGAAPPSRVMGPITPAAPQVGGSTTPAPQGPAAVTIGPINSGMETGPGFFTQKTAPPPPQAPKTGNIQADLANTDYTSTKHGAEPYFLQGAGDMHNTALRNRDSQIDFQNQMDEDKRILADPMAEAHGVPKSRIWAAQSRATDRMVNGKNLTAAPGIGDAMTKAGAGAEFDQKMSKAKEIDSVLRAHPTFGANYSQAELDMSANLLGHAPGKTPMDPRRANEIDSVLTAHPAFGANYSSSELDEAKGIVGHPLGNFKPGQSGRRATPRTKELENQLQQQMTGAGATRGQ